MIISVRLLVLCTGLIVLACTSRDDDAQRADNSNKGAATPRSIAEWVEESQEDLARYYDTDDVLWVGMAEAAAVQAVKADSTLLSLMQLARVRFTQRYHDEAVMLLTRVVGQSRYHAEAWGVMGDAFFESGHYRSADSCYAVMYELDEGFDSLRRIARGKALFGEFEEAIALIDRAIDGAEDWASQRDLAGAYAQIAGIFYTHGFVDAALENIDQSLALFPGSVPNLSLRADILRVKGLVVESDQLVERLTGLSPHPLYITKLARVYTRRGDQARADSLVNVALDGYDRLTLKYYSIIVRCYVEFLLDFEIDVAKALRLAHTQSRKRRDIHSYELLAWAYYKNGDYDLAWSSIGLALRQGTTDPRLVYRAAVIAKAAGKEDKYRTFQERAHDLNPMAATMYSP